MWTQEVHHYSRKQLLNSLRTGGKDINEVAWYCTAVEEAGKRKNKIHSVYSTSPSSKVSLRGLFTSKCNAWVWLSAFISSSSAVTHWYLATQQWHQVPKRETHTVHTLHSYVHPPAHKRAPKLSFHVWFLMWSWQLRTNGAHKKTQRVMLMQHTEM